ncbi:MAG: 4-(cytidine 5'-diphospho)-2-C-methyl-D-erythritol kinase [Gemmatales bacterium]
MPDVVPAFRLAAPAKINVFLEVLGRRSDGFHELVTCMLPLEWADELTFSAADQLTLTCDDPSLPVDASNLVLKAALALQHATGTKQGAAIHLTKRIPSPAGLGGGSSDAATTLRGLDQLWKTQLREPELQRLAATIGSDVPFFLAGSAAWCRGRGEVVEPIAPGISLPLLVICPAAGLSTAAMYQSLQAPPVDVGKHQAMTEKAMSEALRMKSLESISQALFNRLQPVAERCLPLVGELRQLFDHAASQGLCLGSLMSGSGSSYFVVCRDHAEAQRLARWTELHWEGGVQTTSMGTTRPTTDSTDRLLRLHVTCTR